MRFKLPAPIRMSLAIVCLTALIQTAAAGEPAVALAGEVERPHAYSLEELKQMPVTKIKARDHDGAEAEYAGVGLTELLRRAGAPLGENLRGRALTKAVVVHAADGYQALFSLAELDSAMVDRPVLLVWSRNDEPLPPQQGPFRIIAPAEKRQARWVRQVTALEIISLNRPPITNVVSSATAPAK